MGFRKLRRSRESDASAGSFGLLASITFPRAARDGLNYNSLRQAGRQLARYVLSLNAYRCGAWTKFRRSEFRQPFNVDPGAFINARACSLVFPIWFISLDMKLFS